MFYLGMIINTYNSFRLSILGDMLLDSLSYNINATYGRFRVRMGWCEWCGQEGCDIRIKYSNFYSQNVFENIICKMVVIFLGPNLLKGYCVRWRTSLHPDVIIDHWITVAAVQCVCGIHCCDVLMGTMASQISSLTIVYSTVYSDADKIKQYLLINFSNLC